MKHETLLTVRPYECDSYGHVNHANYIHYLEVARMDFLNAIHYDYKGLIAAGFYLFVSRVDISYRAPALSEDVLCIVSEPSAMRRVSGAMHQIIRRGETVIAEATVEWCVVNAQGRPSRPPDGFDLRGKLS